MTYKSNKSYIDQLENDLKFFINYRDKLKEQKHNETDIKSINKQIKKVKRKLKEQKSVEGLEFNNITFKSGQVVHNKELDVIQFTFNNIPNNEVIELLQNCGFKWSNYNQQWQRFFNRPGVTATKWVLYKI